MTNLLIRLFVRDAGRLEDPAVRERYGRFAGLVGIVTNFLLFGIKMTAGTVFHSVAITADAINNLSDSASSVVTMVGFALSGKPADEKHPYGHARIEYLSGLIVALVILLLGFQMAQEAVEEILHPKQTEFTLVSFAVLAVAIGMKLWQFAFYRKIANRIASTALLATAADSRNDVVSTSAILLGALITRVSGYNLDGWMGLIVALLILAGGVKLIMDTANPLLGEAPARRLVEDIYAKVMSYEGVLGLHDLEVHNYGPSRCFASLHCEVPAEQDIMASHDLIDNIERDVLRDMNIHLVIHMDPIVTNDARTTQVRHEMERMFREESPEISMHDFRAVWGETHTNLIFDVCVPFRFSKSDQEIQLLAQEFARRINGDFITVVTVDHSYVPQTEDKDGKEV